jgi:TonB family protein
MLPPVLLIAAAVLIGPVLARKTICEAGRKSSTVSNPAVKRTRPALLLAMAEQPEKTWRVGDAEINPPHVIRKVEPHYTPEARDAKLEGTVLLDGVIAPDGRMTGLRVRRGVGMGLDERALEAAASWEFEPARLKKDNTAVAVKATIEINFRLLP